MLSYGLGESLHAEYLSCVMPAWIKVKFEFLGGIKMFLPKLACDEGVTPIIVKIG